MGRMIDADELIELAKKTFYKSDGFIKLIKEQPTAYDVERVVARLEEEVEYQDKKADEASMSEKVSISSARITMRKCYEHSIDIVRNGGVE